MINIHFSEHVARCCLGVWFVLLATIQEILDYLSLFTDTLDNQLGERAPIHPADMLIEAFVDEAKSIETTTRMRHFLEEVLKMHGMKLEEMMPPEPCLILCVLCLCVCVLCAYVMCVCVIVICQYFFVCVCVKCIFLFLLVLLWVVAKDLNALSSTSHLSAQIPISRIKIKKPDDGLPCVADWVTCCISYIFNGSRLHREPIDLNLTEIPHDPKVAMFDIKKGFTRLILVWHGFNIFIPFQLLCL